MLFNSYPFFVFFAVVFGLYWWVFNKNVKAQNFVVLAASYFFYAWADWRFSFLLLGVTILNYFLGIYINRSEKPMTRKILLNIGLLQGIGGLAFFKYYNFFVTSIADAFALIGVQVSLQTLNIIVPLGISFFTFRTLSYLLDVEKGKVKPITDWISFFTYVSFFPSLLSGPIDKARTFIPQLEKLRVFNYDMAADGSRQILWGFFKKIVVANNIAPLTNEIFTNYQTLPASSLWLGAVLYAFQIYADFSGYSDMAIGFSKLLGFNITKNFDNPFFAQSIPEYWRKWHISLTAWLTEYVFTPLSITFRDYDKLGLILAIVGNFVIVGIWHGANWTYVFFGLFHGLYFIPSILNGTMNKKIKTDKTKLWPTLTESFNMARTFFVIMLTFVIFKADSMAHAFGYYKHMVSTSIFSIPVIDFASVAIVLLFSLLMFGTEWKHRYQDHGLVLSEPMDLKRWGFYLLLMLSLLFFGAFGENQFIYFQF
ncbi:MBOAT family protein [Flavobacterium sp. CYK-4]|uniref:MBOAT family O-acyltransferase n=1 Tax=Flavobacterium lotistagni TaxID=2709660 RepID=UPI00140CF980|nr:MBOAT family protein [Flavobacterium lotistagni]NHM06440.1 MBOAT family protein [Flavobacterium lotistagni]